MAAESENLLHQATGNGPHDEPAPKDEQYRAASWPYIASHRDRKGDSIAALVEGCSNVSNRRSQRALLQRAIGSLAEVHSYRWRVEDFEHPEPGWWATPAIPLEGCACGLCVAARTGRDVHLGSIARIAHINVGRLITEHLAAAHA